MLSLVKSEEWCVRTLCSSPLAQHVSIPTLFCSQAHDQGERDELQSDRKRSYPGILRRAFAGRPILHEQFSSKAPRTPRNPLFPINFTNALLRDSISRLVRRNWAASKLRSRLRDHLWIFVAFRNYVRDRTRKERGRTAAMKLGIERRPWSWGEWLRWRAPFFALHKEP